MKMFATMITTCAALALPGAFAAAHADQNTSGHCTGMTVTDYVESSAVDLTQSTAFVNVTDAHLNFTTSGAGCVAIVFSGMGESDPAGNGYELLHVRTLLDGSNLCVPAFANDTFLGAFDPSIKVSANSITHICKNVAAGAHTVQVQYRTDHGDYVEITAHTLAVTHN